MITKLSIKSGFAKDLPIAAALRKTKLGRLTILWGANGSGKSVCLQTMAAHSSCAGGGWTRLLEPLETHGFGEKYSWAGACRKNTPGNCEATMTWDRVPVFYGNSKDYGRPDIASDHVFDGDGMQSAMDLVVDRMTPKSSGQRRRQNLERMFGILTSAPDFQQMQPRGGVNAAWRECFEAQIAYLARRPDPGSGVTTVLLDEPERNLDAATASAFWTKAVPHFEKHAQVIIATHHPLALPLLYRKDVTWIEDKTGAAMEALTIYKNAFS